MRSTPPRSFAPVAGGRPSRLGAYDILGKIAKGGMATIYLARTVGPDGKHTPVAVKVIRHELAADEKMVQMFLDEASILSRMAHPNIVRTFESGADGDQLFIAMELLVGHSLMDLWKTCAARQLTLRPGDIAWIGARVADALHFAHELNDENGQSLDLVHRDANPSNVFLTYGGEVKLFDFGLVKSKVRRAPPSDAGIVKGKLPYLAPEQIMQMPLDRRSDVFALGTTLWEMATMKRLFVRDSDVDTVKAVRNAPIPDPRTFEPGLPAELTAIILKALERNRMHRYLTAAALAHDLDAFAQQHGATDAPGRIAAILEKLFPEERAKQMGWLRRRSP